MNRLLHHIDRALCTLGILQSPAKQQAKACHFGGRRAVSYSPFILLVILMLLCGQNARAQGQQISGTVFSEAGKPLQGATVRLLNTDSTQYRVALVDSLGQFSIKDIAISTGVLSVQYIGFTSQTRTVDTNNSTESFSFVMKEKVTSLGEVLIKGTSPKQDGAWIFDLTPEQRKRSYTGYDIIDNLMLPGVYVDKRAQSITMLGTTLPVYIDGRRVTNRELLALRKHEVAQVHFYDFPTGRFSGDIATINIITNKVSGGHLSFDAEESLGICSGQGNMVSKYSKREYTWAVWAGLSHLDISGQEDYEETFSTSPAVRKRKTLTTSKEQEKHYYVQSSLSYAKGGRVLMIRPSVSYTIPKHSNIGLSSLSDTATENMSAYARSKVISPGIFGYCNFPLPRNQNIECSIEGLYSKNHYDRSFTEGDDFGQVSALERFFKINSITSYTKQVTPKSTFSLRLSQHLKHSRTEYHVEELPISQFLRSYEGVIFAGMSRSLSKSLMYRLQLGASLQSYQLKGYSQALRVSPRLNVAIVSQKNGKYSVQVGANVGNTYPQINTLNDVLYKASSSTYTSGNPDLKNATLINPFFAWTSVQKNITVSTRANYLYMIDPVVSSYQLQKDFLIRSYANSGFWHDLNSELSVSWKVAPSLEIRSSLSGRYIAHSSSQASTLSIYNRSQINVSLGDWHIRAGLTSPTKRLLFSLEKEEKPWNYDFTVGYTHGRMQVEMNAYNLFLNKQWVIRRVELASYQNFKKTRPIDVYPYVSLRASYTLDYGKKERRAPQYTRASIESAILQ